MEEGIENQGVGIEGYHEVSKCQTHYEHIAWKGRQAERLVNILTATRSVINTQVMFFLKTDTHIFVLFG